MDTDRLKELVDELTLSGSPVLDENKMRSLKKLCKRSDDNVKEVFNLIMTQLVKQHSEIRLSAFLIVDQIFQRSHCFRTLAIKNLNRLIGCVFEVDSANPMPPPQEAAETVRVKAIIALDEWQEKFGHAYKRLKLAHHYLKTCHKIDFQTVTARNRSQQLLLKQKAEQREKMRQETLEKTRRKIEEEKPEIEKCAAELEAGLAILMPTMNNICSNLEFDADDFDAAPPEEPETRSDALRQTALGASYNLEIDLSAVDDKRIVVSEKNAELVRNMDELVKEIEKKKFKSIKKYIMALTKNEGSQTEVVELVNLREKMDSIVKKYQSLKIVRPEIQAKSKQVEDDIDDDEDDGDFEDVKDVNEKEGYEPRIPSHLRAEYGLTKLSDSASSSSSTNSTNPQKPNGSSKTTQRLVAPRTTPKKRKMEDAYDPTSAAATLKHLSETGKLKQLREKYSTQSNSGSATDAAASTCSQSSTSDAPVVQYDRDLYYLFENPDAPMPQVDRNESLHRFWTPREEAATELPDSLQAGLKMRKMHFTGKFVPVQHKCNVMLPSGKLCPRMDRIKCPFHGVIIARDSKGLPLDEKIREKELEEKKQRELKVTEMEDEEERSLAAAAAAADAAEASTSTSSGSNEVAPWLDKDLIKDIEAQTGKDLGSKFLEKREKRNNKGKSGGGDKGKGKGNKSKKSKPESNLTNLKTANDTVRSRLEKKLFNPSTMKRVNAALNQMDKQKTHDKFADQFNYVHGLDKG